MIELRSIEVRGTADVGSFRGELRLASGLQVVSAPNGYGKSLATKAVAWCLGLEAIYGRPDNDASLFPLAVRERINLNEDPDDLSEARVTSSAASITLERSDGYRIRLTREIKGNPAIVVLEESRAGNPNRRSKMHARRGSMQDEHGGLQAFLFQWLSWPRQPVPTFQRAPSEVYAENLAPLFYIQQDHGWGDLQNSQIGRYQQQQIAEISVEYLLGSSAAIEARVEKAQALARETALLQTARLIADRVQHLFARQGWNVTWSGHGSLQQIESRWSSQRLKEALSADANVDLARDMGLLRTEVERLRNELATGHLDPERISAQGSASQRVVQLKQRKHDLNIELHTLRTQLEEINEVRHSIEHRIRAASDVLQLKTIGVGRLDTVECPTCHRDIEAALFALSVQPTDEVAAHLESLRRDGELMRQNAHALAAALTKTNEEAERIDTDFRAAERALQTITAAVGPAREQLVELANKLADVERRIDRLGQTAADIAALQSELDAWLTEARSTRQAAETPTDLRHRLTVFSEALRTYLVAWGHSAVSPANATGVRLDDRYEPYLGDVRLKSLGSASDGARLIAAYTLALAAASAHEAVRGRHPGIVVLDEPLQQNPDPRHRELFVGFLTKQLARTGRFQTSIFTSLTSEEVETLRKGGVSVTTPTTPRLLQLHS